MWKRDQVTYWGPLISPLYFSLRTFKKMQKIKFCFPSTQEFRAPETWYYLMWSHSNSLILVQVLFLCLNICCICTALNGSPNDITQMHLYGGDELIPLTVYFHLFKKLFLFHRNIFFSKEVSIIFYSEWQQED